MTLVWWEQALFQALFFWGLTFKQRGHLGFDYIISIWGNVTKSAQQSDIQNRFTLNQIWCAQQANFTDESLPETSPSLRTEPKKTSCSLELPRKFLSRMEQKEPPSSHPKKLSPFLKNTFGGKTIHPQNSPHWFFIAKNMPLLGREMHSKFPPPTGHRYHTWRVTAALPMSNEKQNLPGDSSRDLFIP